MDELELLVQLQTIQNKLENGEELTEHEHKLHASLIFCAVLGFVEKSMKHILDFIGEEDE